MSAYRSKDIISGYDFVVNSVWPEVVGNLEARMNSIFAPGNPNIFHEVGDKQKALMILRFSRSGLSNIRPAGQNPAPQESPSGPPRHFKIVKNYGVLS